MTGEEIFDIENPCKTELKNLIKSMERNDIKEIKISRRRDVIGNFGITEIHSEKYYSLDITFNDNTGVSRLMLLEDFE